MSIQGVFRAVGHKRLAAVEVDPKSSNQHELNGVASLRRMLGDERLTRQATFIYLGDYEDQWLSCTATVTWYDSRESTPDRGAEYRLYWTANGVMEKARPGDALFIGLRPEGEVVIVIVEAGSTPEAQIEWLFGVGETTPRFQVLEQADLPDRKLDFVSEWILDELGIEVRHEPDESAVDRVIKLYPDGFPSTREFSAFARDSTEDVDATVDPDGTLLAWIGQELQLFRILERSQVRERLQRGFGEDVDAFLSFSLSVQNRRKARAGAALENHIEVLLEAHGIDFQRGATTEGKSRPDFLFPGSHAYHDPSFPDVQLDMLGSKSTCKERWRQVLAEASRIPQKHLLTLEPAISIAQTEEMVRTSLQLVVPAPIQETYTESQRGQLLSFADFIELRKSKQRV